MPLEQYRSVLEIFNRVYQVALGGGEPTLHPDFTELLHLTRECYGIVPNYSTNGDHLSEEVIAATNLWCGAVAVTCHDGFHDIEKLEAFDGKRVVRVAHLLLSDRTLEPIIEFLERNSFSPYLDGIIVLLYKPCGRADPSGILTWSPRAEHLAQLMVTQHKVKVGFDSCLAPLFTSNRLLPTETYDSCEAGRFSLYVDWNSMVSPCSFLRDPQWQQNLEDTGANQIWNSAPFLRIRQILRSQCPDCNLREICFGGCPAYREINLCISKKSCSIRYPDLDRKILHAKS